MSNCLRNLPLVSVVMSAFNSEDFIKEAIDSVLQQTYTNFELLITDDCSTDTTPVILKQYEKCDKRIKCFFNKKNKGLTYNLVSMCKHAKGKFIARLDADDICKKERLEKQIVAMEMNGFDIVCSYVQGIGDNNKIFRNPLDGEDLRVNLMFYNPIVHSSVMFRNDEIFKYNTDFLKSQDYDLWDRISGMGGHFGVLHEVLVFFRFHQNQIPKRNKAEQLIYSNIIRARAIRRLIPDLSESAINIYFNWIDRWEICSNVDYKKIYHILQETEVSNKRVALYRPSSLRRKIKLLKAQLALTPVTSYNTRISLFERCYLYLSSFSWGAFKLLIHAVMMYNRSRIWN